MLITKFLLHFIRLKNSTHYLDIIMDQLQDNLSELSDVIHPNTSRKEKFRLSDDEIPQSETHTDGQDHSKSEFDFAELDPELYGLRRSGRSSKGRIREEVCPIFMLTWNFC
jgi:hypothetical protein